MAVDPTVPPSQGLAAYRRVLSAPHVRPLVTFALLARSEGIVCAFESAHALAHALKLTDEADLLVVNLSGRGDKDMAQAQTLIGLGG